MHKKLNLSELRLQSFVTGSQDQVKGGCFYLTQGQATCDDPNYTVQGPYCGPQTCGVHCGGGGGL